MPDNGTELISVAILRWSHETCLGWHYCAPSKPPQTTFIDSIIGRPRGMLERIGACLDEALPVELGSLLSLGG